MRFGTAFFVIATLLVGAVAYVGTAHAKVLGSTTYKGQKVLVSTGHNNPNNCYYSTNGGSSWQPAPWYLCKRLGAKG